VTELRTGSDNFFQACKVISIILKKIQHILPQKRNNMTKIRFSEGLSSFHHKLIAGKD